ncbi:MAG: 3-coathanger stack domain-containing protein [Leadbetterella sp.]
MIALFLNSFILHGQEYGYRFQGFNYGDFNNPNPNYISWPLPSLSTPMNIAFDFTIEFWLRVRPQDILAEIDDSNNQSWVYGNILIDRENAGAPVGGSYGMSVAKKQGQAPNKRIIAYGISNFARTQALTIHGSMNIADSAWHHIALTRNSTTGRIAIYVDGVLDNSGIGPTGSVAYDPTVTSQFPASDPFVIVGVEKVLSGIGVPSFKGWIDEMRFSKIERYTSNFTSPTSPLVTDIHTVGLFKFNEGNGLIVNDEAQLSTGTIVSTQVPIPFMWSSLSPFTNTSPCSNTPEAPIASAQSFCGASTVANLVANGVSIKWYASQNAPTPLASSTALTTSIYYATQTINSCESPRTSVAVSINPIPVVPLVSDVVLKQKQIANPLTAAGMNLHWYNSENSGLENSVAPIPITTSIGISDYWVSQTVNSCKSSRARIRVTITSPSPCTSSIDNLIVGSNGALIPSGEYLAKRTITSARTMQLASTILFQSGKSITLNTGFSTQTSSLFKAEILPCQD